MKTYVDTYRDVAFLGLDRLTMRQYLENLNRLTDKIAGEAGNDAESQAKRFAAAVDDVLDSAKSFNYDPSAMSEQDKARIEQVLAAADSDEQEMVTRISATCR